MMADNWHTYTVSKLLDTLKTSLDGLTNEEAKKRIEKYGYNEIIEKKRFVFLNLFVKQFHSPIIFVLIVSMLISFSIGKLLDGTIIFILLLFNALLGAFQEYRAEKALQALKKIVALEATVLRKDTKEQKPVLTRVKVRDIVPGDILILEAGDKVPADARIIESYNLEVDESMLTGESKPVGKTNVVLDEHTPVSDRVNMVFAGSIVTRGKGKAIVVGTGYNTEFGQIALLLEKTKRSEIPIQKRLTDLGIKIGYLAALAGLFILFISLSRGFDFTGSFLFVLAMLVSAIPEGLPIAITIALAVGVHRMAKRNALIRNLQAIDSLGCTTVICSDKTGTLTTNRMVVRRILLGSDKIFDVEGIDFSPVGDFKLHGRKIQPSDFKTLIRLLECSALCSDAKLEKKVLNGKDSWEIVGDPTEGALVVAAAKAGIQKIELEKKYKRLDEIPFTSDEKYMVTFHSIPGSKDVLVCLKGAPEKVLEFCSFMENNGVAQKLTKNIHDLLLEYNHQFAQDSLRVIAVAYRKIKRKDISKFKQNIKREKGFIYPGLLGIFDPPRPEAKQAVEFCKKAGIRVIMTTGDHKKTAESIAKELKILEKDSLILTGKELDELSDEELDKIIDRVAVFARVSSYHKYRIVASLKRRKYTVAVTGDGINDAPSLKLADVGIAMGSGTDVAKEASDVILNDDNFNTIVNAIEEGKVIFENLRKVVKYLLSTNSGEILTISCALLFFPFLPMLFTPVQILWINFVTDGLLDKFLAMEPKESGYKRESLLRKINNKLMDADMLFNIIYVSAFMAIGTLFVFLLAWNQGDYSKAQTMGFVTLALFQVFNAMNCRSSEKSLFELGLTSNKYLFISATCSILLIFLSTILVPFQIALNTVPLSISEWLLIFFLASSVLTVDELRKYLMRKIKT